MNREINMRGWAGVNMERGGEGGMMQGAIYQRASEGVVARPPRGTVVLQLREDVETLGCGHAQVRYRGGVLQ